MVFLPPLQSTYLKRAFFVRGPCFLGESPSRTCRFGPLWGALTGTHRRVFRHHLVLMFPSCQHKRVMDSESQTSAQSAAAQDGGERMGEPGLGAGVSLSLAS